MRAHPTRHGFRSADKAFTQDARTALRKRFNCDRIRVCFNADSPVFLLGYSAGRATLVKTLTEEFDERKKNFSCYPGGSPVKAVVSMNAPYNMLAHHEVVEHWAFFYQWPQVESMQKYAMNYVDLQVTGFPGMEPMKGKEELRMRMNMVKSTNNFSEFLVIPPPPASATRKVRRGTSRTPLGLSGWRRQTFLSLLPA